MHLESEKGDLYKTKIYDKRDDFNFSILKFSMDQHLHLKCAISQLMYSIPELIYPIGISLLAHVLKREDKDFHARKKKKRIW